MKGLLLGLPDKEDKDDDKEEGGAKGAAQDLIDAIKDGDAGAVDAALRLHYEECHDEED